MSLEPKRVPAAGRKRRTAEIDPRDGEAAAHHKRGATDYVASLPDGSRHYLYTKPFCTIGGRPEAIHVLYFQDFANILLSLSLCGRSRILDVACGPGWLSEFLYRYGYDVTGVDISEEMLDVARERVDRLAYPPLDRGPESVRFRRLDIETECLDEQFDAVLFYDCLHHFVDAERALHHAARMLAPSGKLLIKEGAMPPPGSEGERALLAESEQYQTLESPFDPDYLDELLSKQGFRVIRRFIEVNGFFEPTREERDRIAAVFDSPLSVNIRICQQEEPASPSASPLAGNWRAKIELESMEEISAPRRGWHLRIRVTNTGDRVWEASPDLTVGSVALGFKLLDASGHIVEQHTGRTPVAHPLAPGQSTTLQVRYLFPEATSGPCFLVADMVLQGAFWFGDRDSRVLQVAGFKLPGVPSPKQ